MSLVNRAFTNPKTGKKMKKIYVQGKGWYGWNPVYKTYNHFTTNSLLSWREVTRIDYDK